MESLDEQQRLSSQVLIAQSRFEHVIFGLRAVISAPKLSHFTL